jgi:hypothetical protein
MAEALEQGLDNNRDRAECARLRSQRYRLRVRQMSESSIAVAREHAQQLAQHNRNHQRRYHGNLSQQDLQRRSERMRQYMQQRRTYERQGECDL